MGYAIMYKLNDFNCVEPCRHTDCAFNRDFTTNTKCTLCEKPIVAGDAYYSDKKDEYQHAVCVMKALDDEKERSS